MSSSSKRVSKKYIDEYKTTSGTIVRKINIPLPKEMPMSIKKAMEDKVKADIEEWKKQYRKSRFEMMQQSPTKEKVARKSPSKEKVAVKAPSKEKVKADIEEWKKQYRKSRREMMQQSPKKRNLLGSLQSSMVERASSMPGRRRDIPATAAVESPTLDSRESHATGGKAPRLKALLIASVA